jgi:hypothetical protein
MSDRYRIDVTQDQRGGLHYRFAVYDNAAAGQLVKMSHPRYATPDGARRRGQNWVAKRISKGKLAA